MKKLDRGRLWTWVSLIIGNFCTGMRGHLYFCSISSDFFQVDRAAEEQLLRVLTTSASKPSLQVGLILFDRK